MSCGSMAELPIKYHAYNVTDEDFMFYCVDICANPLNRNPPKEFKGTLLRIDSRNTPPGYAKLLINHDRLKDKPSYYLRPDTLKDIESGGPAEKIQIGITENVRILFKKNFHGRSIDHVYAVYCPYWPNEADEWRIRKRYHGWPDEGLIARVTRGGCHFVSKLRTWITPCDDSEWRFSFSKAELIVINSWTDVQKCVYHALQLIKKYVIPKYGINDELLHT